MLGPAAAYQARIASGDLREDTAQAAAVAELDALWRALDGYAAGAGQGGVFGFFRKAEAAPQGVYLYGGVGRGKSMLMDMFFDTARVAKKRRVHFHAFMQEIHDALSHARAEQKRDPLAHVAADVIAEAHLLCFDELQITDITDAMIVGRLFDKLFEAGVVVVTTSNRHPDELYKDGLNRKLFLPFIDMIKDKLTVHLLDSDTDHRRQVLSGSTRYFTPITADTTKAIDALWSDLAGGAPEPLALMNKGRSIDLPAYHNGVARVGFADLASKALGPSDFLLLVARVPVLIMEDIPILSRTRSNEAKRFVTLVDAMYEAGTQFIASAEAMPEALYPEGTGAFEFERTASRITEMCFGNWPPQK